jgi:RND family efflux transporter MFP subunit
LRRFILPLVLCLIFSGVLYGLGYPPFHRPVAENRQPRRENDRALAVEVGEVRRGSVEEKITAVGSLSASRYVSVAPKISGRVEHVLVQVGDRVKSGQLIAQLDPRELDEEVRGAEASLKVAEATLKGKQAELLDVKRKLDRAKRLYEKNFISRQELDTLDSERTAAAAQVELTRAQIVQMKARLANAKLQLGEAQLTAPFSGYVEKRLVDPGAMVNAGTPIANLVDIGRVKVIIPVVEKDYPRISVGQEAAVSFDAYPGRKFRGQVLRLTPVLSAETRTGEVEIEVDNSNGQLKPGMFARVEIAVNQRRGVLLIPEGALVKTPSGHGVFRVSARGSKTHKAELRPVQVGASRGGQVEVRGDLEVGDRVVTLGGSLLKDGQSVRISGAGAGGKRRKGEQGES